ARDGQRVDFPSTKIGNGITGHVAATGVPLLVANTLECEHAVMIPGTHAIEESQIAVPLCYGTRVIGVVGISKLGVGQFDEDDVRLLEVLAGHASVALENARLYEAQRPSPDGRAGAVFALARLRAEGAVDGFITIRDPAAGVLSSDELLRLLGGLSYQASVALQRARSFESLEGTFVSTVEALANALEANDEYTSSHTRWITDMALRVGRELGFDAPALKRLELGALFHDIGKIGVPTSILPKPGPLTEDERRVIEMHPELGERILEPIDRLAEVRTIVRGCHE